MNQINTFNETTTGIKNILTSAEKGDAVIRDIFISMINKDTTNGLYVKLQYYCKACTCWCSIVEFDLKPDSSTLLNHAFNEELTCAKGDGTSPRVRLDISGASTDFRVNGSIIGVFNSA